MQIARRLLGKILIDVRNTREEAISVAELKGNQDQLSNLNKKDNECQSNDKTKIDEIRRTSTSDMSKIYSKNDDLKRCSTTTSEISMDQDDDDDKDTQYRLDPKWVPVLLSLITPSLQIQVIVPICFFSFRYANVKSPERHVRTRLYFTSVSISIFCYLH